VTFNQPLDYALLPVDAQWLAHTPAGDVHPYDKVGSPPNSLTLQFVLAGDPGSPITLDYTDAPRPLLGTNGLPVADFAGFPVVHL